MRVVVIISIFLSSITLSFGQAAIGEWQDYLSFYNVHSIAKVNNKIYAASEVGMFSYDIEEKALQKHTKINGLSDIEISAIAAIPNTNSLFIGYKNGNIDILKENSIENIPDLYLKDLMVDKAINHIHFDKNKAYCSTNVGIVVVDYAKREISDTYILGENSSYLNVNQVTSTSDSIFAATQNGILGAPINSNALTYFKTWKDITKDDKEYSSIASYEDKVYAARIENQQGKIYTYDNGLLKFEFNQNKFKQLTITADKVALISSDLISIRYPNLSAIEDVANYNLEDKTISPNFSNIIIDTEGNKWISDNSTGLVKNSEPYDLLIVPDGPNSNLAYKIKASENSLWVVAGVNHYVYPIFIRAECSILRDNKWTNVNTHNNDILKKSYILNINGDTLWGAFNFNDIAIDPRDDTHGYISSAHTGIYEFKDDKIVTHYSLYNDNFPIALAHIWQSVNGVAIDREGNLFSTNIGDSIPILVKPDIIQDKSENNNYGWYKYNYVSYEDNVSDPWLWQTIITTWNHFWCISFRNPAGLFVYDINGTIETDSDDSYRYAGDSNNTGYSPFLLWDEDGKVIDAKPTCLAEDKNGYIWVGTSQGILVYYRPRDIFNIEKLVASRIKIPRNDGSSLADFLLDKEEITDIAVDGANRKWIGTLNNGVYLVSSDGTKTINEFNTSNSPLISNIITSITINPKSGEVFIGTNKGIVSYRGTATEGEKSYSNVKAFPNPVQPNYMGSISVTGLIENSNIRITDISGKVVYQANSTGGQIIWDGKNVFGEAVSSGVYLVFATNEDGSESMVTKIMIIK
ncbi:type IX secretion system anionic LPS delivery protein PorZ [Labilibacter marinus]|uniref:type IX secretion system anionic LPS delivery protein PorZ n=1 Tax=Labilibacter marinus TaxID=1477105 RepID=UPI000836E7A1|nr:T9SS type A sorting domain-containing protein [Labilibacter marinus]